jgi:hypothetical protein
VKLLDALQEKGLPFDIPNAGRNDLPELFVQLGFKVGVEIGVYKGWNTAIYLRAGLKVYGVDPWSAYGIYVEGTSEERARMTQERMDYLYSKAQRNLRPYLKAGLCELIRKPSMEAVKDFPNGSLDFVYIDGSHAFRYIAEDLYEWTPKVRKGGIVSGHDYCSNAKEVRDPYTCHVPRVVDAWMQIVRPKSWYVIGNREKIPGEVRDPYRSWFWVVE